MRTCYNCKGINRENDTFCRNCGLLMRSNTYYILINVGTVIILLALVFVIILFVASYYVY